MNTITTGIAKVGKLITKEMKLNFPAAKYLDIDADSIDRTAEQVIKIDVGINSADVNVINATVDIGTLLTAGEVVKGIYFDMNEAVVNADTSAIVGYDTTITGLATSRNDIVGFRATLDGTKNGGDTSKAFTAVGTVTLNNAGEYLYGSHINFSGITQTNGIVYGEYIDVSAAVTAGTAYGSYYLLSAAATGIYIDAGTNQHVAGNIIDVNLDVNSANVNLINATIDIDVLLTAGEVVKGCYFDINEAVACANTSVIAAYDTTITGFATGAADLVAFRATLDGTKDTSDTTKGVNIIGTVTLDNAGEYLYGTHIDFSGITQTEGIVYGNYVNVSATVTAGTAYGSYYMLSAAATGIYIDAGTTDHGAGNIIDVNLDVNSADVNLINATIDIGTLLTAGEEVKGCYFDINEVVANADTSAITAYDTTITGFATGRADLVAYKATIDGSKTGGDTTKGLNVVGTVTLNNASEYLYGSHIDLSGITQTDGIVYGQYIDVSATVTSGTAFGSYYKLSAAAVGIHIDAGTVDHIAGNIIYADIDVNSASVNGISFDIDVGTALTTGETVNGISLDLNGDGSDHAASAMNGIYITSANATGGINTAIQIAGTFDESIAIASTSGRMNVDVEIDNRDRLEIYDDFTYQVIDETTTPWILNSGGDAEAIDPAIDIQENGVVKFETGDVDGTVANDGCQLVCAVPVQADSGGLVMECRLHINTAITTVSVNVGLTDVTTLEEPFTIAGGDAITAVADDAVCFVYDTAAATDQWFACAVDGTTVDTGNATTGVAPIADVYQVLRIEVSADGATIKFLIDGVLVKTLSAAAGVSPDVNLYATVVVCSTTTTLKTVDVDYIYVGHNR